MTNINQFSIISELGDLTNYREACNYCLQKKLYKTLSLILFSQIKTISCPSTILITTKNESRINDSFKNLRFPVLVRIDYSSLPKKKFLGGIEIKSLKDLLEINNFIIKNNCFTILHPNFRRLKNKFNIGVLFIPKKKEIIFEYLGEGFDASDLRLGKINPHEIRSYSLLEESTRLIKICSNEEYEESRKIRINQILKILSYQDFVNRNKKLVESFDILNLQKHEVTKNLLPPLSYKSCSPIIERNLIRFAHSLNRICTELPESDSFVASISLNNNQLLLWDIYGKWYNR